MTIETDHILISFISLIVGGLAGWFIRGIVEKIDEGKDLKNFVILIVSVAWITSVVVEMFNPSYHMSPMMHGLMGSIVGFFINFKSIIKPIGEAQNESNKDKKSN